MKRQLEKNLFMGTFKTSIDLYKFIFVVYYVYLYALFFKASKSYTFTIT